MQVVYTPAHLATTSRSRRSWACPIPANEVAERAEKIRSALEADGGFPSWNRPSTAKSRSPRSTTRGSSGSWRSPGPRSAGRALPRPFLTADTYPNRQMFEGMSAEAVATLVREPEQAAGRAGFWGLDSAAPLVAGTYGGRAGRRRRGPDLGRPGPGRGERRLWALPAARPSRRTIDVWRLLLLQQRGDRGRGDRAVHRRAVAIFDVDYHHGNGSQQIFWRRGDVRYVSIHADPDRAYPYFLGRADEIGEGAGAGENLNIPLRAGATNDGLPGCGRSRARGDRRGTGLGHRGVARVRHVRPRSRSATSR